MKIKRTTVRAESIGMFGNCLLPNASNVPVVECYKKSMYDNAHFFALYPVLGDTKAGLTPLINLLKPAPPPPPIF